MSEARRELVVGGGSAIPRAAEVCSEPLWKHVGHGDNSALAIEHALRAENALQLVEDAKLAAPLLRNLALPCGPACIESAIAKLALTLDPASRRPDSDEAERYRLEEYVEALGHYPVEAVMLGATDCRDTPGTKFFPTIGELLVHIKPRAARIRSAAYRAARIAEGEGKAKRPPDDPDEKARQIAATQEYLARMGRKSEALQAPGLGAGPRFDAPKAPPAPAAAFRAQGEPAPGSALTAETIAALRRQTPVTREPEPRFEPEPEAEAEAEGVLLPWD